MEPPVSTCQLTESDIAELRGQLQRVLESRVFRDAEMLRRLLHFLGEATLDGEADQLKEYAVGVQALGRPDTYDTRTDSSVRVLAGKLRQKLSEYYSTEGTTDPVEIGLPKGRYRLSFTRRALVSSAHDAVRLARRWRLAFVGATSLAVVAAVAAFWAGRQVAPVAPENWAPELKALWAPLLDGKHSIILSYDGAVFVRAGSAWPFEDKLTATDAQAGDQLGFNVALNGSFAIAGAPLDDIGAGNVGSLYVFASTGSRWIEQAKLTASDGAANDQFGWSVALAGDKALVGANLANVGIVADAGAAYVFRVEGDIWVEQAKVTAGDPGAGDEFAAAVSLVAPQCLCRDAWDRIEGSFAFATVFNVILFSMAWALNRVVATLRARKQA